uniref:Ephrin_rec_like domain-containing protein n=1 Tax=Heterorhabditis bacteriophora TaxID=37862 RepID=A0A1I7XFU5_HETBA
MSAMSSSECIWLSLGQYSLGGGIRYEEFTTLPVGFSIENFDADSDQFIDTSSRSTMPCPPELVNNTIGVFLKNVKNTFRAGWVIRNEELLYIPTPCISRLSFSASLVRAGFAEYSYHMPRNNRALSLQVDVRNQQCQSYRRRIELRSGTVKYLSWTVSNSAGMKASSEPIRIARIDILGLAFIQECSPCPAGTYSDIGSAECIACAAGFHSSKGAGKCERCPESQFSGPKSAICVNRPPCRQSDFYPVTESCNNGSTRTIYKKVQPEVCRVDLPGAADLPPPGPWRSCPTCNPGMEKDQHGVCVFCEKEHFSDGNDVSLVCNIGEAWFASGSALISASSLEKGIALEMVLSIDEGFSNPLYPHETVATLQSPVAHITIVFDTFCADSSCVLYILEGDRKKTSNYRFLAAFNGTQPKRVWSHSIVKQSPAQFMNKNSDFDHLCIRCPVNTYVNTSSERFLYENYGNELNYPIFYIEILFCYLGRGQLRVLKYSPEKEHLIITLLICHYLVGPSVARSSLRSLTPLAMRLEAISVERQHNAWKLTNQMLEYEGIENSSLPMDIHLWFDTVGQPSEACPIGNTFVITARCQPTRKQPEVIRLPHTCPDGTCDGCLFNAIIESAQACPVCKAGDYEKIRGECVQGQQTIHYIPDKFNYNSILSPIFLNFLFFRLEYKYTRLIESRTGELPTAESCGLEEDEDDETTDRVIFSKGKKRLFSGREDKEAFVPLENED